MKVKKQKTKILIDNSITGGRGMAKQGYEFVEELKRRKIDYLLCTDEGFAYKLRDIGVEPDIIVPTAFNEPPEKVNQAFAKALEYVEFEGLIKIGARMSGPQVAYKRKRPYVLIDAALPDVMDSGFDTFYPKDVFIGAKQYLVTTQFPWQFPNRFPELRNARVVTYPFSEKTKTELNKLRLSPDKDIKKQVAKFVPEVNTARYYMSIMLVITGSYIGSIEDRCTYGGWLTSAQYDQVVGFCRRFITDLGEQAPGRIIIYMDKEVLVAVSDLKEKYKSKLTLCTSRSKKWNYQEEFFLQRWADILVSRAANYQPFMAYLERGGIITTPVPSDGYMDEDQAAIQSSDLGLSRLVTYNDEEYIKKLLNFSSDKLAQAQVSQNLKATQKTMFRNKDCIDIALKSLGD